MTRTKPPDKPLDLKTTDKLLKALLVLARTVNHTLESRVIDESDQPLSKSKVQILRLLGQRGPQNSTQLAKYLSVSKPAVSELVESLVKSRLITRRTSGEDRRAIRLDLTTAGRQIFRKNQAKQRHRVRNAMRTRSDLAEPWVELIGEMTQALAQGDRVYDQFCFQCRAHEDKSCVLTGGDAGCPYVKHPSKRKTAKRNGPNGSRTRVQKESRP